MNVGLLMIREENDILERVLDLNDGIFDVLFVLDGTQPNDTSAAICAATGKLAGYWTDADLPRPPYPEGTTCGYRGFIYRKALDYLGSTNCWFLELHGDEVWQFHPDEAIGRHPDADGFIFPLPFYFPRDPWQDDVHPLDQLAWHFKPGWPEFRMFRGNPDVHFDPTQHFNTQPAGLTNVVYSSLPIKHYPYRAPQVQRARAAIHRETGFDPDNYRHITDDAGVVWTDEMIQNAVCAHHTHIEQDAVTV